ncbi:hypothetical protein CJ030_MR4G016057 [Morella rubra]|uniref:Uncharacterized protein n=1 Tax=Morella rubra TaxID=262757 RepID=A0A6A1W2A1_9ROSI|nr:hypothetical protein CJ030_MR4G016057 [Morella rubra]
MAEERQIKKRDRFIILGYFARGLNVLWGHRRRVYALDVVVVIPEDLWTSTFLTNLRVYALDVVVVIPEDLWTSTFLTNLGFGSNNFSGSLPAIHCETRKIPADI